MRLSRQESPYQINLDDGLVHHRLVSGGSTRATESGDKEAASPVDKRKGFIKDQKGTGEMFATALRNAQVRFYMGAIPTAETRATNGSIAGGQSRQSYRICRSSVGAGSKTRDR